MPKPAPLPLVAAAQPGATASPSAITREEVQRLIAERDAFWMSELQRLTQTIAASIAAAPSRPGSESWRFTAIYDKTDPDKLLHIDAKPRAAPTSTSH